MQIEWANEGCRSSWESSEPMHQEPTALCKEESMAEVSLGGDRKKRIGWNRDRLWPDALKRGNSAVYGRLISWSCGQEWWRTELELCRGESFDDGHRSAALGTAPQRLRCRSGRGLRFVFRWSGVENGEALWQQGGAASVGEEAEVADADEALGEQVK